MVHDKGLEPLHLAAQPPEDCVSTNSTLYLLRKPNLNLRRLLYTTLSFMQPI